MDIKKTNAAQTTKTYNRDQIENETQNIYEAISIISKRADQITDNVLVIEDMLFDFDKYSIKPQYKNLLDRLSEIIKDNKKYTQISIIGHTDNVGDNSYNLDLSKKRAKSIYQALLERGVDANRLSTVGYGEDKPKESNKTRKGRIANRRVEFKVVE